MRRFLVSLIRFYLVTLRNKSKLFKSHNILSWLKVSVWIMWWDSVSWLPRRTRTLTNITLLHSMGFHTETGADWLGHRYLSARRSQVQFWPGARGDGWMDDGWGGVWSCSHSWRNFSILNDFLSSSLPSRLFSDWYTINRYVATSVGIHPYLQM